MPWNDSKISYFKGLAWFLLSLVVCTTNDVLTKYLSGHYPTLQVVCLRYAFASLLLLAITVTNKNLKKIPLTFRISRLHFIRASILLLAISLYCYALDKLPISTVISLNFVIPIFTLVFAYAFLEEKIELKNIIATIVGFIGVYVVFEPSKEGFVTFAALLLLLSSALFAVLDIINKKFLSNEGVFRMVFYTAVITFLLSLPFSLTHWEHIPARDLFLFAALGLGANLLLYCILKAFQKVAISAVAPFRYLELILACIAGFVLFGEIPRKATILGSLIIIPSSLYIALSEHKSTK